MIRLPRTAALKALSLIAGCVFLGGATATANASGYTVSLQQIGSNVVATGNGALDLTNLNFDGTATPLSFLNDAPLLLPNLGFVGTGVDVTFLDEYSDPIPGPFGFGSGNTTHANFASGDFVELLASLSGLPFIFVPEGYVSDSPLSDSATYLNATFASLGVTPGTYVWRWGTGADQRFTLEIGTPTATPLPAALPLFVGGLGALGLLGWRRKQKAEAFA